ncbi:MAG: hypothetical protein JWM64_619, partial [Frankiales bacterium]|nr:hypothetical protein [Frankiales bacterium]
MSTPEPPSGPPAEAPHAEPGHRARALAASLLGELTGQRKTGLTFSPLEATGLSVVDRAAGGDGTASREEASPADATAPEPSAAG